MGSASHPEWTCTTINRMPRGVVKSGAIAWALMVFSQGATAGVYGSERWGEMYWGANTASAPVGSPSITSATATDDQITIVLDDFPVGTGADGWSAVRLTP